MFDYVRSQVPLPDGFQGELQSKDFDCAMAVIEIRGDGTLWIERYEQEMVPETERPYPDATDWRKWVGSMRRINERWERLSYHGDMNFYGNEGRYGEPGYCWHEYVARFSDGHLDWIKPTQEPT